MKREEKERHMRKQIDFLYKPGDTFELCAIGSPVKKHPLWGGGFANNIIAGWFNDVDKAVELAMELDAQVKPVGIYLTVNPCNKQMRAVSDNCLKPVKTRTQDDFIDRIENFFIDVDPIRPAGTSSSVDQLGHALELALQIREELPGKENCLFALSGNGYHLTYKADGISPDEIKKILNYVSDKYSNEYVDVDRVVFNPARLIKCYGTKARKGDVVPALNIVHRVAVVKEVGDEIF